MTRSTVLFLIQSILSVCVAFVFGGCQLSTTNMKRENRAFVKMNLEGATCTTGGQPAPEMIDGNYETAAVLRDIWPQSDEVKLSLVRPTAIIKLPEAHLVKKIMIQTQGRFRALTLSAKNSSTGNLETLALWSADPPPVPTRSNIVTKKFTTQVESGFTAGEVDKVEHSQRKGTWRLLDQTQPNPKLVWELSPVGNRPTFEESKSQIMKELQIEIWPHLILEGLVGMNRVRYQVLDISITEVELFVPALR